MYPCTVVQDRYDGGYSKGKWIAFPCKSYEVPSEIYGSDIDCMTFWADNDDNSCIGKGCTIEDAYEDLRSKCRHQQENGIDDKNDFAIAQEDWKNLHIKIVNEIVRFCIDHGLKDVDKAYLYADDIQASIEHGSWAPVTDSMFELKKKGNPDTEGDSVLFSH